MVTDYDVTQEDRELLAQAYEETSGGGPFPFYAAEARGNPRAFTRCALRAIARARLGEEPLYRKDLVEDFIQRLGKISLSAVFIMEADAVHQAWIRNLSKTDRDRIRAAIQARMDGPLSIQEKKTYGRQT